MSNFWSTFTLEAQRVVYYAQEEAGTSGGSLVSSSDLLVGLLHEPDSVVRRALTRCGVDPDDLRRQFARERTAVEHSPAHQMLLAPDAKNVFDVAHREFVRMNSAQFREEHILLGLLLSEANPVAKAFADRGVPIDTLRRQLLVQRAELSEAR